MTGLFLNQHFYPATSKLALKRGGLFRAQCLGRVYRRKEQGVGEVDQQIRIAV